MAVWSASVGVDGANCVVLALAGEAGAEVFASPKGARHASSVDLCSVLRADVPSHLAEAADWGGEMAMLLVPVRGPAPAEGSPELRPTDVWMWSGRERGLERYLRFGAPVTGLRRVGGPMRETSRVAVLLPGEVFVFQGRTLEHKFGMAVRPAPSVLREDASSWDAPPDLSLWRPAAAVSSRFLAVATVDDPLPEPRSAASRRRGRRRRLSSREESKTSGPPSRRAAAEAVAAAEADGASAALTLRTVAQDAAVGILRLGKALAGAGTAAAAGASAAMASSATSLGAGRGARRRPRAAPAPAPGRWDALLEALERSSAEAKAAGGVGCVAVVDLASSRPVAHWRAHQSADVTLLALSPSGTALVTGDGDGQSLRLWRVLPPASGTAAGHATSRRLLARLDRSLLPSAVRECAIPPDAAVVASLSARETLHVWATGARSQRAAPPGAGESLAELERLAGDGREEADTGGGSARPGQASTPAPVARVEDSVYAWREASRGGAPGASGDDDDDEDVARSASTAGASSAPSGSSVSSRAAAHASTTDPAALAAAAPTVVAAFRLPAGDGIACAALTGRGGGPTGLSEPRGDLESVGLAAWGAGGGLVVLAASRSGALSACRLSPATAPAAKPSVSSAAVAGLTALLGSSAGASSSGAGRTAHEGQTDAPGGRLDGEDDGASRIPPEDAVRRARELVASAPVGGSAPSGCGGRWRSVALPVGRVEWDAPTGEVADVAAAATSLPSLPSSTTPALPIPVWARPNVRVMVPSPGAAGGPQQGIGRLAVPASEAYGPGAVPPRPVRDLDDGLAEALAGSLGSPC